MCYGSLILVVAGCLGVSWACQANVFRMVAAVLALGDVDFVERSEARDGDPLSELAEACRPRLEAAASLLDVSPEAILSALISRKINAGISNQVGPVAELGVVCSAVLEIVLHSLKNNIGSCVAPWTGGDRVWRMSECRLVADSRSCDAA